MPLFKEIKEKNIHLLAWKIEEPIDFFQNNTALNDYEKTEFAALKNLKRKKEWLATRFLLKKIIGNKSYIKNEEGKPILTDNNGFISISHCSNFAAAAFSKKTSVGIDIEPIHEKVARVAHKFLSQKELSHIEEDHLYLKKLTQAWTCKESIYKKYKVPGISFANNIEINFSSLNKEQFAEVFLKKMDKLYVTKVRFINIESCILAYTI